MITLIAAVNKNMLLGKDNTMPWHVKEDLQYFKKQTLHKDVLMGRKTYESLPGHLKDRTLYVLTKQEDYELLVDNVHVIHDIEPFIARFKGSEQELMVAGGGSIYEQFIRVADRILLSIIDDDQHGDVYFPEIPNNFKLNSIQNKGTFIVREYVRHG